MQNEEKAIEIIRQYKELLDDGAITQEEFEKKKAEMLSDTQSAPVENATPIYAPAVTVTPKYVPVSFAPQKTKDTDMSYAHFIALGIVCVILMFIALIGSGYAYAAACGAAAAFSLIYGFATKDGKEVDNDILKASFKHIFTSTGFLFAIIILSMISFSSFLDDNDTTDTATAKQAATASVATATETTKSTTAPTTTTSDGLTGEQRKAKATAQMYLQSMPFSRDGLISQLEYEKFSKEDATIAVDKLNINWRVQAVREAEVYLSSAPFSRTGLIKQLEYEKYSSEDAKYAVENITVDWNEQAVLMAKQYVDTLNLSHGRLIDQLEYEGFTHEQAKYGADHVE